MKRSGAFLVLAILATAGAWAAAPSRIIGKYAQFRPSTDPLKSEYGTSMGYGGEINISLSNYVDLWFGAMHHPQQYNVRADTRASLTPVEAGIKVKIPVPVLGTPYFGAGAVYATYAQKAAGVESSANGLGYCVQAGIVIPPCSGRACSKAIFSLDLFLNYSKCEVDLGGRPLDVGGLRVGVGWGFGF
ncbi:MAG: outer membrane beta-barrel protein [Candidatus Aminicenantes bacterium]|nr:outer membrane beta-barrel protein [Candidatus Aminicenantes bacterium]